MIILTADEIRREYSASRSRKAAYFLMQLCASSYTEEQMFLLLSISIENGTTHIFLENVHIKRCTFS